MSALSEDLWAIRMELKGVREAVSGLHSVDKAQKGVADTTTRTGVAAEKAEKKTSRLSRAFGALGKAAKYGLGFLGVAGVFALKSAIDNTEELSKTTVGLARNFDLQTNVASRWAAVAHARSIDSKALSMTFGVLSSKMVEAGRKGGTALTPFHQLGLTQEDAAKGARNFQWGLLRVADALGDAEGGAKRTTAAKALLGRGFQTLLPLFSEGTKGLREQLHWADKYGVTLDGKTNDSIMDMVTAQRESKVATLGLQIALTKALMPAIEGGQHELQKFIATLNSDDLTADQKIHRIEQQFLGIEDTLIDIVTAALPKIAEHGGELGVKLAGAVWHGFWESDALGKFVIAGWLFMAMGGGGLIRGMGGKAGLLLARGLLWVFIPTVAAEIAAGATFGSAMSTAFGGLRPFFGTMGAMLGRVMGAGLVLGVILLIPGLKEKIRDTIMGEQLDATDRESLATKLSEEGWNVLPFGMNGDILKAIDPAGKLHVFRNQHHYGAAGNTNSWQDKITGRGKGHSAHRGRDDHRLPRASLPRRQSNADVPRLPRMALGAWGGRRETVVHTHVHLDGKEIAESTARHVAAAEALA